MKKSLFAQIDQLERTLKTAIETIKKTANAFIGQILALTEPITSQVDEFCRQIDQAATSAATSVNRVVNPATSAIASARSPLTAFTAQLAAFEKEVAAFEKRSRRSRRGRGGAGAGEAGVWEAAGVSGRLRGAMRAEGRAPVTAAVG